ncbi:glutathione synthase [Synchytrium microbalum]|uniref:glutathione synthase n=1 Tax=Synchytrium microbalum TaxID=1806994 RepID=A0A507C1D7_9FUNG|nr:glutathione synthase [Synchytrium microbalum]TPX34917.1 glutathione synthase [Synchytrium microbalum]
MYPPIDATSPLAHEVAYNAIDYAMSRGLVVRAPASVSTSEDVPIVTHAPFALFPTPFPKSAYENAVELQPIFNKLVDCCARDHEFITEAMESLSKVDDFVEKLYDIYKKVHALGTAQKITFGLHRSDYMLHNSSKPGEPETLHVKQVELNTIAASFSSLSHHVSKLHQYLVRTQPQYTLPEHSYMPENTSIETIPRGLAKAWQLYGNPKAVVVIVVQPGERNAFDQRWIEYTLYNEYSITLIRKSLAEIHEQASIHSPGGPLILNGQEVAVTYFRAGYSPTDYPTHAEWDARLLIESSSTIKCPNIAYHLVGSKKVQQILDQPGMVERFIHDADQVAALRKCFMGLYPLDGSAEGIKAMQDALESPERFVMKPQREGGGNNIYGDDIKTTLQKLSPAERNAYILMDLIKAPVRKSIMVRLGKVIPGDVVSEVGIYGIWISEGDIVHMNETGGHLLRTKASNSNEGGVAAGFAVLDSPLLIIVASESQADTIRAQTKLQLEADLRRILSRDKKVSPPGSANQVEQADSQIYVVDDEETDEDLDDGSGEVAEGEVCLVSSGIKGGDDADRYWLAFHVPWEEMDSSMVTVAGVDMVVVRYWEDYKYGTMFPHELKPFVPGTGLYEKMVANRAFTSSKGYRRAMDFLNTGKVPKMFKWKNWGMSGKYRTIVATDSPEPETITTSRPQRRVSSTQIQQPPQQQQQQQPVRAKRAATPQIVTRGATPKQTSPEADYSTTTNSRYTAKPTYNTNNARTKPTVNHLLAQLFPEMNQLDDDGHNRRAPTPPIQTKRVRDQRPAVRGRQTGNAHMYANTNATPEPLSTSTPKIMFMNHRDASAPLPDELRHHLMNTLAYRNVPRRKGGERAGVLGDLSRHVEVARSMVMRWGAEDRGEVDVDERVLNGNKKRVNAAVGASNSAELERGNLKKAKR